MNVVVSSQIKWDCFYDASLEIFFLKIIDFYHYLEWANIKNVSSADLVVLLNIEWLADKIQSYFVWVKIQNIHTYMSIVWFDLVLYLLYCWYCNLMHGLAVIVYCTYGVYNCIMIVYCSMKIIKSSLDRYRPAQIRNNNILSHIILLKRTDWHTKTVNIIWVLLLSRYCNS